MNIIEINFQNFEDAAGLAADFRVVLNSYKGIVSNPNLQAAKEELQEYLDAGFPVFAAEENGRLVGYLVCRVEEPCVWVEAIYVTQETRSRGIASALLAKAEEIAAVYGEETVFNYVHPNNHGMIRFLRKHGYTVLNLIEIRKPYQGENLSQTISVGSEIFDY